MSEWEYISPQFKGSSANNLPEFLNQFGKKGWELVESIGSQLNDRIFIFKRRERIEASV